MAEKVSVPSRGILFPNRLLLAVVWGVVIIVSVPSRGILFPNKTLISLLILMDSSFRPLSGYLISKFMDEWLFAGLYLFPSPLGVSYFQIFGL